jgi:hypothetical protein
MHTHFPQTQGAVLLLPSWCCVQVHALLAERLGMVTDADSRVDWAMAEALAFGTLLLHRWVWPARHVMQQQDHYNGRREPGCCAAPLHTLAARSSHKCVDRWMHIQPQHYVSCLASRVKM